MHKTSPITTKSESQYIKPGLFMINQGSGYNPTPLDMSILDTGNFYELITETHAVH